MERQAGDGRCIVLASYPDRLMLGPVALARASEDGIMTRHAADGETIPILPSSSGLSFGPLFSFVFPQHIYSLNCSFSYISYRNHITKTDRNKTLHFTIQERYFAVQRGRVSAGDQMPHVTAGACLWVPTYGQVINGRRSPLHLAFFHLCT